jgi:hypothetical protein
VGGWKSAARKQAGKPAFKLAKTLEGAVSAYARD